MVAVPVAAGLVFGGVAWAVAALGWPAQGLPDGWLDRGDQIASITSMLLTAIGVTLAYLALRGSVGSARSQEAGPSPQLPAERVLAPFAHDPLDDRNGRAAWSRPEQLPAGPLSFTGRAAETEQLLRIMPDPEKVAATVIISAIDGMAGIGKTALAVHVGHRIADRYPDGQLFIDLHGFTQGVPPVEASDALDRMLRQLGIPGERIPSGLDERAGLWRSTLAGRRMLIVLDNAATEAQVVPLLPGTPGCLVIITSRRSLIGLASTHSVSLDVLPRADAVALFTRTAGEQRVAGESPELVAETVELCGRVPLAIWIAAARLRLHSTWTLADLVERLRAQQRLAELEAGQSSVTGALEVSYQQLSTDQQRVYRLVGLHPGPDIDSYATAALADTSPERARRLLDDLLEVHLLQEPIPGRFVFHDLIRAHATQAGLRDEAEPQQRAALSRLLDYYRLAASMAMDFAHPYERERRPRVSPAGAPIPDLREPIKASAWLETELLNLLAATRYAAGHGWPEYVWHLSAILHRHLRDRGRYRDAEALHIQALTTARATGHSAGELDALLRLGHIYRKQGKHKQAIDHLGQALEIARTTENPAVEVDALTGLGQVRERQGRHEQATDHLGQALEIARRIGNRTGELDALGGLAWVHLMQDRYEQATDAYRQVLDIGREIGNRTGELDALLGLGWVHLVRGRYTSATDHYRQVLETARTTGNHTGELDALLGLARVHRLQRRYEQATEHYSSVLEVARTTGNRTGELDALIGLGHVHRLQGRHEQATRTYAEVLDGAGETGNRNGQFEAMHGLGRLHHATGRPDLAHTLHLQALELATDLGQPTDQARAHDGLAHAHYALNQYEQARERWQQALNIITSLGFGLDQIHEDDVGVALIRAHLASLGQQLDHPTS